jgi:hypothetical protein
VFVQKLDDETNVSPQAKIESSNWDNIFKLNSSMLLVTCLFELLQFVEGEGLVDI